MADPEENAISRDARREIHQQPCAASCFLLQSDTVDAVHVSDRGHVDGQVENALRALLLFHGTCHIPCAHITSELYQGVRETHGGGLAKRLGRERSQDHAGQRADPAASSSSTLRCSCSSIASFIASSRSFAARLSKTSWPSCYWGRYYIFFDPEQSPVCEIVLSIYLLTGTLSFILSWPACAVSLHRLPCMRADNSKY